jgi:U3 small nucleolar RNA-associated protein 13
MIDRKVIVSASEDKTIKIWPLVQQKDHLINIKTAISTVSAHAKSINAVRTSPNEDFIATCSHDRTVKIWGPDLKPFFTLSSHRRGVWDAAFHPVEKLVVTVAGDGALKGWSLFNGDCLWSLGEGFAIMRCQWIYHHQVITGSIDGIVKIWDIRKQTSLSYDKHEGKIWALDVMKDESNNNKIQVMTGGNDSILYAWKDST